jgi:hypothetical protein
MAGNSARARRTWRLLLACVVAATSLAWAVPSIASASTTAQSGHNPALVHTVTTAGAQSAALAPLHKGGAAHHATHQTRSFDAAAGAAVSVAHSAYAVSVPARVDSARRATPGCSAAIRAPPVEGSA